MKRLLVFFCPLFAGLALTTSTAQAQLPYRIADVNPNLVGSEPSGFVALPDGTVLFAASDPEHGRELWRSDGTAAGTYRVRDIYAGPLSSGPEGFVVWDGVAYFAARDADHGLELWRSDGTEAGTFLVHDIQPGPAGSLPQRRIPFDPGFGVAVTPPVETANGVLFGADDGVHGVELWVSDGTTAGTSMLGDLYPGTMSSQADPTLALDGLVYIPVFEAVGGGLWVSDGTVAGTRKLALPVVNHPSDLVVFGDRVCFGTSIELFCTDGTDAGTVEVANLGVNGVGGLTPAGGLLFFTHSYPGLIKLFVTDGTPDTERGLLSTNFVDRFWIGRPTAVGDRIVFPVDTKAHGEELWVSDGTPDGTTMLVDLHGGAEGSEPSGLTAFGDDVVFGADDGESGRELWRTDGTADGTVMIADASPGAEGSDPTSLVALDDRLWMAATGTSTGAEPWTSDGTAAGTAAVAQLDAMSTGPANVRAVTRFGELWLFFADDGTYGDEPWVSDGTEAGTRMLRDIATGSSSSNGRTPVAVGDRVFFAADDGSRQPQLWVSDGTPNGTNALTAMPTAVFGGPEDLVALADRLLFTLDESSNGRPRTLWRSDGTVDGTVRVRSFPDGTDFDPPCQLYAWRDMVLFVVSGDGLWRTDGTSVGTVPILDASFGCLAFEPSEIGDALYFNGPVPFSTLWRTDGTAQGTEAIVEFGDEGGFGPPLLPVPGGFVFSGAEFQVGSEPWFSDGTRAGTDVLADLVPGMEGSFPTMLASVPTVDGERALFLTGREAPNRVLWQTDGTLAGTQALGEMDPEPGRLIDGRYLFTGVDEAIGRELWVSDGRTAGTRPIADLAVGARSTTGGLGEGAMGGRILVFPADDGISGAELWALDTLCFFGDTPLWLHEGRFRVDVCWRRPDDRIGVGRPVAWTEEAGGFTFFNPDNLDLAVKIHDGRLVNGKYWFFFGGLTDVAGKARITDTERGVYREFELAPGEARSFAEVDGFPIEQPVSAAPLPAMVVAPPGPGTDGGCGDDSGDLCVQDGRFRVHVEWATMYLDGTGQGVRSGANSGTFWFFRPGNLEILIKIHDGRPRNGHFWVFAGALSNVAYTITVTDSETGVVRTYENPQGTLQSFVDTRAFASN